jgi:hypothetical protein
MCKAIDDPKTGNNTFAKLYGAASVYYNYSGNATCFNLDDDSDPHGLGGWSWQVCRTSLHEVYNIVLLLFKISQIFGNKKIDY